MNTIYVWNDTSKSTLSFVPLIDPILNAELTFCVRDRQGISQEVKMVAKSIQAMIFKEIFNIYEMETD